MLNLFIVPSRSFAPSFPILLFIYCLQDVAPKKGDAHIDSFSLSHLRKPDGRRLWCLHFLGVHWKRSLRSSLCGATVIDGGRRRRRWDLTKIFPCSLNRENFVRNFWPTAAKAKTLKSFTHGITQSTGWLAGNVQCLKYPLQEMSENFWIPLKSGDEQASKSPTSFGESSHNVTSSRYSKFSQP